MICFWGWVGLGFRRALAKIYYAFRLEWQLGRSDVVSRNKKTLYEILGIPANTRSQDILVAYQQQLEQLRQAETLLGHEEYEYQLTLLNLARDTLSDPSLRRGYDEKLMFRLAPNHAAEMQGAAPNHASSGVLAQRAEVLSLRADALALRADAMAINNQAPDSTYGSWALRLKLSLQGVLVVFGILALIWTLIRMLMVPVAVSRVEASQLAAERAEEQLIIQEYYQKHGVRPASAAEVRLLEAENRRRESERDTLARQNLRAEQEAREFEKETRMRGDRISAELREGEERLKREEMRRKEEMERKAEMEQYRRQEAEERLLAREQKKWKEVLSR